MPSLRRRFRMEARRYRKAVRDFLRGKMLSPTSSSSRDSDQSNYPILMKSKRTEDVCLLSEESSDFSETCSLVSETTEELDVKNNIGEASPDLTETNTCTEQFHMNYFARHQCLVNTARLDLPCLQDLTLLYKTLFKSDGVIKGPTSHVHRVISDGDKMVVKIMNKELLNREGAIHSHVCGHNNIPHVYGITRIGGDCYGLVQEYAAGKTLEMMSFDGDLDKLSVSQKLQLASQLCDAVCQMHKNDVIHQNIHPGHIIVNPKTFNVKLVPSSTAAFVNDAGRFRGLGETRYLSPESVLDDSAITPAEDVWSLGMILAEIFTGFRPYLNHPGLFSMGDYESFHRQNRELPRFRQRRTSTVEWRLFRGHGTILEQVGVLINLAVCPTPELRPSARQLLGNFKMLMAMQKDD